MKQEGFDSLLDFIKNKSKQFTKPPQETKKSVKENKKDHK
jgi:hypothetical protein